MSVNTPKVAAASIAMRKNTPPVVVAQCFLAVAMTTELPEACGVADVADVGVLDADTGETAALPDAIGTAADLPELSRFNRFKSARISLALWQRRSRSFSSAVLMISSSFSGSVGLMRIGAIGARFRMLSKITADVSPVKATFPVAIW